MKRRHLFILLSALLLALALVDTPASAHEVRPAVVTADLSAPGRIAVTISTNVEAMLTGIGPNHKDTDDAPEAARYKQLRALTAAELARRFEAFAPRWLKDLGLAADGKPVDLAVGRVVIPDVGDQKLARISQVELSGSLPADAKTLRYAYPSTYGSSILRVKRADGAALETNWLKDGASAAAIPVQAAEPTSRVHQFYGYVWHGFSHILPYGLDHILFVLGLFFLSTQVKPLLVQVTAFTIAHSITLALGLYGVLDISPKIVEPLIALSIVYVAVENIMTSNLMPWRPFVVFGFGLLHGLGFAGLLTELDLARDQYLTALVGFNLGVECGQLAVIALAWLATAYWFGAAPWYRRRIVVPASLLIASMGAFWTIERLWSA